MAGAVQPLIVTGIRCMYDIGQHRFAIVEKEEDQRPENIRRTFPLKRSQLLQDGCI